VKLSKNLRGQAESQPKIWEGPWPTQAPLRTATVALSFLCDIRYSKMEKLSWEFIIYYNITSQGNDNASQNESKIWNFQWRKGRTVLFSQSE